MTSSLDSVLGALIRINHMTLDTDAPNQETIADIAREMAVACDAEICSFRFRDHVPMESVTVTNGGKETKDVRPLPRDCTLIGRPPDSPAVISFASDCPHCDIQDHCANLCAPLGVGDDLMGVMRLSRSSSEVFSSAAMEVAASVGSRIGAAIRRKRLVARLQEANEVLEARVEQRTRELGALNAELKRQTEAAITANEAKTQFLANMSHEIRTPMNGILGMAEVMSGTTLTNEQRGYLDTITRCAQSLLDLLNDVLDLAKVEAGQVTLERIPFDPRQVVEAVGAVLGPRAAEGGIELVCRVASSMPAQVLGDPTRLRQILSNLATNAIKFTRHGEVMIVAGAEPEEGGATQLWFEVRDTGIGIPEDQIRHLFDKFTQIDGSTSRRHGGTGLGLAICKELIELMDGTIEVESREDVGSTFHVSFPAQIGMDDEPAAPPRALQARPVMVVDDNASSRAAVAGILRELGCVALSAPSGKVALERIAGDPPDAVVIDASMSELDGYETSVGIRSLPEGRELPIVLMVAGARNRHSRRARDLGIAGFVQKPVRKTAIVGALSRALSQQPRSGEAMPRRPAQHTAIPGTRVLLVEDNAINSEFMSVLLRRAGYDVVPAATGDEAIVLAASQEFDIVLMDVQMPGKDGFETTAELRASKKTAEVPILAVTAHAMRGDDLRCIDAGMDGYVAKPIDASTLFESMERAMASRRMRGRPAPALASPDPGERPPIDLDRLAEDTDWDFAIEHVARFLKRASELARDAAASSSQEDLTATRKLAHQIRGGAVHMPALIATATEVMKAAHEGDAHGTSEHVSELERQVARAREYYERRMGAGKK